MSLEYVKCLVHLKRPAVPGENCVACTANSVVAYCRRGGKHAAEIFQKDQDAYKWLRVADFRFTRSTLWLFDPRTVDRGTSPREALYIPGTVFFKPNCPFRLYPAGEERRKR